MGAVLARHDPGDEKRGNTQISGEYGLSENCRRGKLHFSNDHGDEWLLTVTIAWAERWRYHRRRKKTVGLDNTSMGALTDRFWPRDQYSSCPLHSVRATPASTTSDTFAKVDQVSAMPGPDSRGGISR